MILKQTIMFLILRIKKKKIVKKKKEGSMIYVVYVSKK